MHVVCTITGCSINGKIYRVGQEVHQTDPCNYCTCDGHDVTCVTIQCPLVSPHCTIPPGKCCAKCKDDRSCEYNGQIMQHGQTFRGVGHSLCDDIIECRCNLGEVECEDVTCPQTDCEFPIPSHIQPCCPSCSQGKLSVSSPYQTIYSHAALQVQKVSTLSVPHTKPSTAMLPFMFTR